MQSASVVHEPLQDVPPQTYGSQACTVGDRQLPAPSQVVALVAVPPLQEALPHEVPTATWAQL
jgi:hypothetical protein